MKKRADEHLQAIGRLRQNAFGRWIDTMPGGPAVKVLP